MSCGEVFCFSANLQISLGLRNKCCLYFSNNTTDSGVENLEAMAGHIEIILPLYSLNYSVTNTVYSTETLW